MYLFSCVTCSNLRHPGISRLPHFEGEPCIYILRYVLFILFYFYFYLCICFCFLSLTFFSFLSVNASGLILLAFVCRACTCGIQYEGMSLHFYFAVHCCIFFFFYNVVSLCRVFVTTELVMKSQTSEQAQRATTSLPYLVVAC